MGDIGRSAEQVKDNTMHAIDTTVCPIVSLMCLQRRPREDISSSAI